jgi:cytosine/adenosine deaminase-related metal-dependent hydrolase
MTYRKFKADYLFTGREMAAEGSVLVTAADGTVVAILPAAEAGEDVETYRGLLSPGFINCHCHLELSHMKGVLPERTGLVDFLLTVIRQRNAGEAGISMQEKIQAAMAAAEEAMLDNGIVAVGDICNTADTLPLKRGGRLYYHNFIETMGFVPQGARDRFDSSRRVFESFAEAYNEPMEANSLVPHAPYSVSSPLFELIAGFPGNHILTIHNQETAAENTFYLTGKGDFLRLYAAMGLDTSFFPGTGKRSLESYLPHFYRNQSLILVHNVDTTEEDLRWLSAAPSSLRSGGPQLFFCLCPNANLYISGQLPDPDLLIRYGHTIVTGTDSLASNHQLSILEELKTIQHHFPHLPTAQLLQWATFNGAAALQLDSILGSFEKSRQPGVLVIEDLEGDRFSSASKVKRLL